MADLKPLAASRGTGSGRAAPSTSRRRFASRSTDLWTRLEALSVATLGRRVLMTSGWGGTDAPMATAAYFRVEHRDSLAYGCRRRHQATTDRRVRVQLSTNS
jgi:hypothetical protein